MKGIKRLADKKYFMTIVWIFLIIAIWEVFAFYVAATKRTPENILPHLSGIIESVVSKKTINGWQTPFVLRGMGPLRDFRRICLNVGHGIYQA